MNKFKKVIFFLFIIKLLLGLLLSYTLYGNKNTEKFSSEKKFTIVLWESRLPLKNQMEIISGIIKEFNEKYPNIEILVELISPLAAEKKLENALALGNPPHIVSIPFDSKYKNNKYLVPLILSNEELNNFSLYSLECFRFDNKYFYLPRWYGIRFLAANKEYLNTMEIDIDLIQKIGWREDDLIDLLKKDIPKGLGMPREHLSLYPGIEIDEFLRQFKNYETTKKENLYRDFLANAFGIIGPVGPEFIKRAGDKYAAIPFPHFSQNPVLVGRIEGLMFLGQYPLKGHDELEAAQIFGKYYSYHSSEKFSTLLNKVPVYIDLIPSHFMGIENFIIIPVSTGN